MLKAAGYVDLNGPPQKNLTTVKNSYTTHSYTPEYIAVERKTTKTHNETQLKRLLSRKQRI